MSTIRTKSRQLNAKNKIRNVAISRTLIFRIVADYTVIFALFRSSDEEDENEDDDERAREEMRGFVVDEEDDNEANADEDDNVCLFFHNITFLIEYSLV